MDKSPNVNVRVPRALLDAVREYAKASRRSAAAELAVVIEEALAARGAVETRPAKPDGSQRVTFRRREERG
jgi:hypothetical protein